MDEMGIVDPEFAAVSERRATTEEVITTRLIVGNCSALFKMDVVPLMAGRMMSFSGSSVGCGSGLARCKIDVTPSKTLS